MTNIFLRCVMNLHANVLVLLALFIITLWIWLTSPSIIGIIRMIWGFSFMIVIDSLLATRKLNKLKQELLK